MGYSWRRISYDNFLLGFTLGTKSIFLAAALASGSYHSAIVASGLGDNRTVVRPNAAQKAAVAAIR